MVAAPLPPEAGPRGLTIRSAVWLILAAVALYMAGIAVVLLVRTVPQATALRTRGIELQVGYVTLRGNAGRINRALNLTDSLLRSLAHGNPFDTAAAGHIRSEIEQTGRAATVLITGERLAGVSAPMREALAQAAEAENRLTPQVLEVLAALQLRDLRDASAALATANVTMQSLWDVLGQAQILGIENIVRREQALGQASLSALRSIALWIGGGLLLLPLLALWLHRRIYRPLAAIDGGLGRIAGGQFDTPVPVLARDELGRLSAHLNTTMEVLRQRTDEERARTLNLMERFGLVLDESASEIYIFERETLRLVQANRGLLSNLGYSQAELAGRAPLVFLPEHTESSLRRLLEPLESGARTQVRAAMRHRRRDGRSYPVAVTYQRSLAARPPVFLAIAEDLSERQAAEAALRESEERYRVAFEQAAVGIAEVGLDGRFVRVNQALCDTLGYRRDELLALQLADVDHPDELATAAEQLRQLLAQEVPSIRRQKRYRRRDGGVVHADVSVSLVRDASGRPRFLVAVVEDITERRQLETQLAQAQKMEAIGRLAGGVAHDFNNLLTVIITYAELTATTLSIEDPRRRDVEEVARAAARAAGLTRQLLSFARRQPVEPRPLNLSELVLNLDGLLRRTLGEDVELVTVPEAELWPVNADPGQLEQVLMNLAVNARDAMPDGGTLTVRTENRVVRRGGEDGSVPPGEYVLLSVRDTGVGMAAEVKARLFEPFFTTKEIGKGTGLGLATCYGIVQNAGGRILVDSEPGQGATFRVYLPRVTEAAAPLGVTGAADQQLPSGWETVLVVEDEPQVRELMRRTLASAGYRVLTARNGEEALAVGTEHLANLALVLTDIVLPLISGPEVARALSRNAPGLRILFTSGYAEHPVAVREDLVPGAAFLAKPFSAPQLARRVREILDRARVG